MGKKKLVKAAETIDVTDHTEAEVQIGVIGELVFTADLRQRLGIDVHTLMQFVIIAKSGVI